MSKDQKLPTLTDAQLEIMNVVWGQAECSVADVWKVLRERRGVSRNTVHTLIARLEEKGWLARSNADSAWHYRATVSREATQQSTLKRMVATVFNGSAESLVLTLLHGGTVSKSEAARIRRLIANARGRKS